MSWQERIEMRALKEELICESSLQLAADQYSQVIERSLCRLSTAERKVIFLRFWEGLPIARIADRLDISWEEADREIDMALHRLRAHIQLNKKSKSLEANS